MVQPLNEYVMGLRPSHDFGLFGKVHGFSFAFQHRRLVILTLTEGLGPRKNWVVYTCAKAKQFVPCSAASIAGQLEEWLRLLISWRSIHVNFHHWSCVSGIWTPAFR